jgi:hypothetical protein
MKKLMIKLFFSSLSILALNAAFANSNGIYTDHNACKKDMIALYQDIDQYAHNAAKTQYPELQSYYAWAFSAANDNTNEVTYGQEIVNGHTQALISLQTGPCGVLKFSQDHFNNQSLYTENNINQHIAKELHDWQQFKAGNITSTGFQKRKYTDYQITCHGAIAPGQCSVSLTNS